MVILYINIKNKYVMTYCSNNGRYNVHYWNNKVVDGEEINNIPNSDS